MRVKNMTLGTVAAVALIAPLALTAPAMAEPGDQPDATLELPAASSGVSDQADAATLQLEASEADDEALDIEVEGDEIAVAPGTRAVSSQFGNLKLTGPGKATLPRKSDKNVKLKLTFNGPAVRTSSPAINYYVKNPVVKMVGKNKKLKKSRVWSPPYLYRASTYADPSKALAMRLSVYSNITTPGKYKMAVPVEYYRSSPYTVTKKTVTKHITLRANTKYSKARTGFSGYAAAHKKFPVRIEAPGYQAGAKATVYFKANGSKKYKKVAVTRLKSKDKSYSRANTSIPAKYNAAGKGGRVYIKVGKVAYAGSYKSSVAKIRKY